MLGNVPHHFGEAHDREILDVFDDLDAGRAHVPPTDTDHRQLRRRRPE